MYANGEVYCGMFKNDKKEGAGEMLEQKDQTSIRAKMAIQNEWILEVEVLLNNECHKVGINMFKHLAL